jgi:predicted Zn-dependent protease
LLEYAMGVAHQSGHRDSAATAAFQKTLTENLGYYMAHLHLASEALAMHDTATALAEARSAADVRPDDPVVQLFLGETLLSTRHPREALEPLRAAVAADPYYALPYYYLGRASELARDAPSALAGYRGYLARAKRRDSLREDARQAIAHLAGP